MPVANGSSAMLRACLTASAKRRWQGVHTPLRRRGTILPRSEMNCEIDLLHAELANLAPAEKLALIGNDRFVAARGSLRTGNRLTASGLCHISISPCVLVS
jgi:hypothetical protein